MTADSDAKTEITGTAFKEHKITVLLVDDQAIIGEAVRRLVPEIADEDLSPDLAGIRAKLQGPGEGFRDFVVTEESARGLPGFVNLIGIDSPGLTSCLALAEEVDRLLPG